MFAREHCVVLADWYGKSSIHEITFQFVSNDACFVLCDCTDIS